MNDEKNLKEFLKDLLKLTVDNINYLDGVEIQTRISFKYIKELQMVQDLINNFEFVKENCKNE